MSDNVWTPGKDERTADGSVDLGEPQYERGVPFWQAFWVPHFFANALAVSREQPTLVYGSAAVLACLGVVAGVVTEVSQRYFMPQIDPVRPRPEDVLQIYIFLLGILMPMALVFGLIGSWVNAGAQVAIGSFVRTDRVSIAAVFLSARHALSRIAYQFLCWALGTVAYIALVLAMTLLIVFGAAGGTGGVLVALLVVLVLTLPVLAGAVWALLSLVPGVYAATFDTNPIEAFGVGLRSVEGGRWRLLLLWLIQYAAVTALAMGNFIAGAIAELVGPLGIVVTIAAAIVMALPATLLTGFWNAGVATSWMLHSRDGDEARKWACIVRNELYPET